MFIRGAICFALGVLAFGAQASPSTSKANTPSFEVAAIKPTQVHAKQSRFMTMQSADRFVVEDYSLRSLIAAAYDLNPKAVLGGPAWVDNDHFDILALTPGRNRPTHDEQMTMLRALLADRFHLNFHRRQKMMSVYELEKDKGGAKLKATSASATDPSNLISVVYPGRIVLPARNATMSEFASILQRAILDRPVLDRTGLNGRYDFNLQWAPDETQFGGEIPAAPANAQDPPFFTAIREQLGLRIEHTRGPVEALVIDRAEPPSPN
jgi:uncharacterized protein (TIGR03435 family)